MSADQPDPLDPGPAGDWPWFPRDSLGHPFWSDRPELDTSTVDEHGVDVGILPVPRGLRRNVHGFRVDVTPTWPHDEPTGWIYPTTIPPAESPAEEQHPEDASGARDNPRRHQP